MHISTSGERIAAFEMTINLDFGQSRFLSLFYITYIISFMCMKLKLALYWVFESKGSYKVTAQNDIPPLDDVWLLRLSVPSLE